MIRRRRSAVIILALVWTLATPLGPSATEALAAPTPNRPVSPAVHGDLGFGFHAAPYEFPALPPALWPHATSTVLPLEDAGIHDEFGVRMVDIDGVLYDHPVAQARYATGLLASHDLTGDPAYLARAEAQAQRLLDRAVPSRGAIYFPYGFGFARHGDPGDMVAAPWYSAMAQGEALTALVRLYERTANEAYAAAAHETFASFRNLPAAGEPWTVDVDAAGYLWLEEYPGAVPDRTYNGLVYALYGLWDYHRWTADPDALALLRGAVTTVSHYFPSIRVPNWVSRYCLAHGVQSGTYHETHLRQQLTLFGMTGDVAFARNADLLYADYPSPLVSGTLRFHAGTFTGYRFTTSGALSALKTGTLPRASAAPFNLRVRIKNRPGYWYQVTAGIWKGYLIAETGGRSYAPGFLPNEITYPYLRPVTFAAGRHTGYAYALSGAVTTARVAVLARPSIAHTDQRIVINGVVHLRITNGIWAGMYVPLSSRLSI